MFLIHGWILGAFANSRTAALSSNTIKNTWGCSYVKMRCLNKSMSTCIKKIITSLMAFDKATYSLSVVESVFSVCSLLCQKIGQLNKHNTYPEYEYRWSCVFRVTMLSLSKYKTCINRAFKSTRKDGLEDDPFVISAFKIQYSLFDGIFVLLKRICSNYCTRFCRKWNAWSCSPCKVIELSNKWWIQPIMKATSLQMLIGSGHILTWAK